MHENSWEGILEFSYQTFIKITHKAIWREPSMQVNDQKKNQENATFFLEFDTIFLMSYSWDKTPFGIFSLNVTSLLPLAFQANLYLEFHLLG